MTLWEMPSGRGKKGDANLLLGNYVIVHIVLLVLEACLRIAFFSGDAQGRKEVKIFAFCLMRITRITHTRFCSQFTKEF
ncbi:MAG: hypothetical protein HW419_3293 [Deltaproteobacteria bacterium]|nr:hypothetical protein [Deltaproteobacteria bacterium]